MAGIFNQPTLTGAGAVTTQESPQSSGFDFSKFLTDNKAIIGTALGGISDLQKRRQLDRLAQTQVATSPFLKNDLVGLADKGSLGTDIVSDIADSDVIQKLINRDKSQDRVRETAAREGLAGKLRAKKNSNSILTLDDIGK